MFRRYKEAYTGLPTEIWIMAVVTVLNRMGTMVLPFLSVYLTTELDFSFRNAGLLASAFGLGSFGGAWLGGKLSDRIGTHKVIIFSLGFSGILLICLQFGQSFWVLFSLIFSTALFGEAYRPAITAAIGEFVSKSETGRATSLIRLAINLGMSVSPVVGGFVATSLGYQWLFWIDGATCVIAAVYFAIVSRHWTKQGIVREEVRTKQKQLEDIPPSRNPSYLLFMLSSLFLGFAFVQWFHTVPVFIKTSWGYDERYIGLLMALSCLMVMVIEMPVIHALEKGGRIKWALLTGAWLIGGAYLVFLLPQAWILGFGAVMIWTMGEILFLPFNTSVALNMSPEGRRGDYMAWYWMAWSLAGILAPSVGLGFAERFGFEAFWLFTFGVAGLSILTNLSLKT
jgi:MFS family permease